MSQRFSLAYTCACVYVYVYVYVYGLVKTRLNDHDVIETRNQLSTEAREETRGNKSRYRRGNMRPAARSTVSGAGHT